MKGTSLKSCYTFPIFCKGFVNKWFFMDHVKVHDRIKANTCPKCCRRFTFSSDVTRHLHNGVCTKRASSTWIADCSKCVVSHSGTGLFTECCLDFFPSLLKGRFQSCSDILRVQIPLWNFPFAMNNAQTLWILEMVPKHMHAFVFVGCLHSNCLKVDGCSGNLDHI